MVQYILLNLRMIFFMSVSARINFGAESDDPVRYPDDPFDRIWTFDAIKKANCLVDVAAGTERVSTKISIDANTVNVIVANFGWSSLELLISASSQMLVILEDATIYLV